MKKIVLSFLALCSFVPARSLTAKVRAESIVSVKASDIRSGSVSLQGWEHISSGQPDAAVLDAIKAAGFKTVIDLRGENEDRGMDEAGEVEKRGMRYFSLPIESGVAADVSYDNARQLDRLLAGARGRCLLHCASGNRVGAIFALRAKLAGASADEAMALGKAAGLTRLEPVVTKRLQE